MTPLWWWSFEEDGVEFEGRDGGALLDGERVCAGAEGDVNEVQREVQQVGCWAAYVYVRASSGEWVCWAKLCNDEAGLGAVDGMRWPALSRRRMLAGKAAARQIAWSFKQVT